MSSRTAAGMLAMAALTSAAFAAGSPAGNSSDDAQRTSYTVDAGTRIPLGLINSVSTKHSVPGDRVYLQTVFPIVIDSHIVIPPGSYVAGTVTEIKRPGRLKGKGELYVRFDSLTLPNGVTRDFRSRIGSVDARGDEHIEKKEGIVQGDSNKGGDAKVVAETTMGGASLGALAGSAAGHAGMGAGIGAAAGAVVGLAGVLVTRGPDAVLAKGSTVEMILDRPLTFEASEVNFVAAAAPANYSDGPGPQPKSSQSAPVAARRFPF